MFGKNGDRGKLGIGAAFLGCYSYRSFSHVMAFPVWISISWKLPSVAVFHMNLSMAYHGEALNRTW